MVYLPFLIIEGHKYEYVRIYLMVDVCYFIYFLLSNRHACY